MNINISLRQSWTALILIAVIVPTITLMIWFGYQLYTTQLNSALQIEQKKNEFLRDQIGLKLKLVKMLLHNRVKPLALLVNRQESQNIRKEINRNLSFILERELFVREIMIFSTEGEVIAVIDPNIGITKEKLLPVSNMQAIKQHYGFSSHNKPPELIIPSFGRDYISSPKLHDGFMGFKIAMPIGDPVKAIMVAVIDIEKLWSHKQNKVSKALSTLTRDYLLDGRGSLITTINDSDYKVGDLMTHLEVARKALINAPWKSQKSYIGINGQRVFGTITTIPILNWTLVSEVISAKITRPIWLELIKVFVFILLGLATFIWLILYLAKKTIQPIQAVCNATHKVTLGDYKIALKPCGIKELDVLAADFNLMAKSRQKAEEKLKLSERVFKETHDGILITDKSGIIIDVNPTFSDITGYSHEEIIGQNTSILRSYKHNAEFYQTMQQIIIEQGHWQGEIWNRKKNGELYAELLTISTLRDDNSKLLYYVGIFSDITSNKRQQEKLELMAHYDVLTNLPNRALFTDRFNQAIAHSKRTDSLLAICFLDIDNFKPINDNFDHQTGDLLLVEVAERIKSCIREEDTVSRQGGDEFTVLLGNLKSHMQCEQTLIRMQYILAQPYLIEGNQHTVTMSIGVTMYPTDNSDIDVLIRHADQAMYQAKQSGRNRHHFFNIEQD
ncbi:MAG: diguanylate cyclase [Alteromonadaceae bacterium]|nr:diguanylate cyclase [Alteromonadaceae bacterium]